MSYDIIRGIKVKDNKVFLKSSANNVYPKDYTEWECVGLSKILQDEGKEVLDIEILKDYEQGNFQAGVQNKYTRALTVLLHTIEYKKFDWRGDDWDESQKNSREKRTEFLELLKKALHTKLPKDTYIITKTVGLNKEQELYFSHHKGSRFCRWHTEKNKATKFNYKEDAENTKKYFVDSENWEIIKLLKT